METNMWVVTRDQVLVNAKHTSKGRNQTQLKQRGQQSNQTGRRRSGGPNNTYELHIDPAEQPPKQTATARSAPVSTFSGYSVESSLPGARLLLIGLEPIMASAEPTSIYLGPELAAGPTSARR